MSKPIRRGTGLWAYLEKSGVLESGSEEAIAAVKKEYRRFYQREYRKQKRKERPEVTITLDKPDWFKLTHAAQRHHDSLAGFIKGSALAYLDETYLVPDPQTINHIAQRIRLAGTDIRVVAKHVSKRNLTELHQGYMDLAERIHHLEETITQALVYPPKAYDH
ncbi:MAG: hypothetical protein AAFR61_25675 [Bacteroidota bacterium]